MRNAARTFGKPAMDEVVCHAKAGPINILPRISPSPGHPVLLHRISTFTNVVTEEHGVTKTSDRFLGPKIEMWLESHIKLSPFSRVGPSHYRVLRIQLLNPFFAITVPYRNRSRYHQMVLSFNLFILASADWDEARIARSATKAPWLSPS